MSEELDRAADLIREWVAETDAPETIAVLVREQRQRDRLVTGLAERGVTIRAVDHSSLQNCRDLPRSPGGSGLPHPARLQHPLSPARTLPFAGITVAVVITWLLS